MMKGCRIPIRSLILFAIANINILILLTASSCSLWPKANAKKELFLANISALKAEENITAEYTQHTHSSLLTLEEEANLMSSLQNRRAELKPRLPVSPKILDPNQKKHLPPGVAISPFRLDAEIETKIFPQITRENPSSMTIEEKMLAWGYVHPLAEGYESPTTAGKVQFMSDPLTRSSIFLPEVDPVMRVAELWTEFYLKTGKKARSLASVLHTKRLERHILEGNESLAQAVLDYFTSPVSGKLIEISHPEFSAGNMYVDAFTFRELEEVHGVNVKVFTDILRARAPQDDARIIAFRVYGKSGVIRTGWLLVSVDKKAVIARSN